MLELQKLCKQYQNITQMLIRRFWQNKILLIQLPKRFTFTIQYPSQLVRPFTLTSLEYIPPIWHAPQFGRLNSATGILRRWWGEKARSPHPAGSVQPGEQVGDHDSCQIRIWTRGATHVTAACIAWVTFMKLWLLMCEIGLKESLDEGINTADRLNMLLAGYKWQSGNQTLSTFLEGYFSNYTLKIIHLICFCGIFFYLLSTI